MIRIRRDPAPGVTIVTLTMETCWSSNYYPLLIICPTWRVSGGTVWRPSWWNPLSPVARQPRSPPRGPSLSAACESPRRWQLGSQKPSQQRMGWKNKGKNRAREVRDGRWGDGRVKGKERAQDKFLSNRVVEAWNMVPGVIKRSKTVSIFKNSFRSQREDMVENA
jgi:hypothetical protein